MVVFAGFKKALYECLGHIYLTYKFAALRWEYHGRLTDIALDTPFGTGSMAIGHLSKCVRPHQVNRHWPPTLEHSVDECRLGTIFMDLDALSGVIAYKHTGESVTTVTAAVDRITINHPLDEICDLELSGQVTFATGRSSMEISLQVAKAPANGQVVMKEDVLLTCAFTMVSLDPFTKKAVAISPLQIETAEERRLYELGEKNYNAKKAMAKTALLKQTPNDEESDLIHAMWLKQLAYHGNEALTITPPIIYEKNIYNPTQIPTNPSANPTT